MDENIAIITNINRLCRTCLLEKSEEDLQSIFENSIDSMLSELADVKVSLNNYFFHNSIGIQTLFFMKGISK